MYRQAILKELKLELHILGNLHTRPELNEDLIEDSYKALEKLYFRLYCFHVYRLKDKDRERFLEFYKKVTDLSNNIAINEHLRRIENLNDEGIVNYELNIEQVCTETGVKLPCPRTVDSMIDFSLEVLEFYLKKINGGIS